MTISVVVIFRKYLNLVFKNCPGYELSVFRESVGRHAKEKIVSRNTALIERVPQTSLNQLDGVKLKKTAPRAL